MASPLWDGSSESRNIAPHRFAFICDNAHVSFVRLDGRSKLGESNRIRLRLLAERSSGYLSSFLAARRTDSSLIFPVTVLISPSVVFGEN